MATRLPTAGRIDRKMFEPTYTLDQVQLAMPAGEENRARAFYVDVLGFEEIPKPAELAKRGGAWFRCGSAAIHLGVDAAWSVSRVIAYRSRRTPCRSMVRHTRTSRIRLEIGSN